MAVKKNTFNAEAQRAQRATEKNIEILLSFSDSLALRSLRLCVECARVGAL